MFTGRVGVGQELAGVRHDRRGVAAADQRDLQRLRAGLHADAGAARGRRARRADDGDPRRPGADGLRPALDGRHRHRRQRACCGSCSAGSGKPHIGSPQAFSFNVAVGQGERRDHGRARAARPRPRRRPSAAPAGMCPRCEGRGAVTDFDLTALYDDSKSLERGRADDPRLQHGRLVRPHLPRLRLLRPGQADPQVQQARARTTCSTSEPTKIKVDGINLTYEGLIPQIQKSFLVQGSRRDAAARPARSSTGR